MRSRLALLVPCAALGIEPEVAGYVGFAGQHADGSMPRLRIGWAATVASGPVGVGALLDWSLGDDARNPERIRAVHEVAIGATGAYRWSPSQSLRCDLGAALAWAVLIERERDDGHRARVSGEACPSVPVGAFFGHALRAGVCGGVETFLPGDANGGDAAWIALVRLAFDPREASWH